MSESGKSYDLFLSFANEDKESIATPLANALMEAGLEVWYSGFELTLGDSIAEKVNIGLGQSNFGIVILSPNYLAKDWPKAELHAFFAQATHTGKKVILPVWHNISYAEVLEKAPLFADKFAIESKEGIAKIVEAVVKAIGKGRKPISPPPPVKPSPKAQLEKMETLLAKNKVEKVIEGLMEYVKTHSKSNSNNVILLSSRWLSIKEDLNKGILHPDNAQINKNRIINSISDLIRELQNEEE